MLKDIGHPFADGEPVYDTTFENVQAGERTSHLFRLANLHRGLVVGTGDLSELALGWCTYGVGDHMSHYGVNASVPKTLIQYIIRWVAAVATPGPDVSPDAVRRPGRPRSVRSWCRPLKASRVQSSEAIVGPYELQDFNLYYTLRFGYPPPRVAFLAYCAWHDRDARRLARHPAEAPRSTTSARSRRHLGTFLYRFFQLSQFKRSAHSQRAEGRLGRLAVAARRLPRPQRRRATAWLAQLELIPDAV